MNNAPKESLTALEHMVERLFGPGQRLDIEPMAGGVSLRRFLRVRVAGGPSWVAMIVPDTAPEAELARIRGRWPFLEVRELLESRRVHVPRVFSEDCDHGVFLVEDLGETLAEHLDQFPELRTELYRQAVGDLARAQRALAVLPEESVVRTRTFDEKLLRWEIDHYKEWALEALGFELTATQKAVFERAADYLSREIAAWPRGFVHRDYQSRNLMIRRQVDGTKELVWIDFQDAMLGPRVYDLVALLTDSYQSLEPAFAQERLDEYANFAELSESDRAELLREFHMVTVQRKLKDAGRFIYVDKTRGDRGYLPYVGPAWNAVREALVALADDAILAELDALLEELGPPARG